MRKKMEIVHNDDVDTGIIPPGKGEDSENTEENQDEQVD